MKSDIVDILRTSGIKPSYTRIRILECLTGRRSHPSVDEIYKGLSDEIPTLSRTTVYNTVGLFVTSGILKELSTDGCERRYDSDIKDHGHFICNICGQIYDFSIDADRLTSDDLNGFSVKEKNIYLKGICKKCKKNK